MNTSQNINRLLDVEMNVTVRFGKTELPLREVVHFGVGSMLELNRTVDDPVELLVNNYPFARGEVVVIDGYYGVRVTEIGSAEERTQSLFPTAGGDAEPNPIADFNAALASEESAPPVFENEAEALEEEETTPDTNQTEETSDAETAAEEE